MTLIAIARVLCAVIAIALLFVPLPLVAIDHGLAALVFVGLAIFLQREA